MERLSKAVCWLALLAAAVGGVLSAGTARAGVCWNEYRVREVHERAGHPGKGPVVPREVREERRVCDAVAQGGWRPLDERRQTASND
jgi:hypothetical protein